MNPQHTKYLFDNFPFFGEEVKKWGIACGDGWFVMIKNLCEKIVRLQPPADFTIVQVKEKYGTLRCYTENSTPGIEHLIFNAEQKSAHLCEYCGAAGNTCKKLMILKTVCLMHEALSRKERIWPSV